MSTAAPAWWPTHPRVDAVSQALRDALTPHCGPHRLITQTNYRLSRVEVAWRDGPSVQTAGAVLDVDLEPLTSGAYPDFGFEHDGITIVLDRAVTLPRALASLDVLTDRDPGTAPGSSYLLAIDQAQLDPALVHLWASTLEGDRALKARLNQLLWAPATFDVLRSDDTYMRIHRLRSTLA